MAKKMKKVNLPRGGYRLGSGKDNFMNTVQVEAPGRNTFDLTHGFKFTGKVADLMPCLIAEVVPGDSFKIGCDILTRLAPMQAPMMDHMTVRVEYFYVPNRIVWPESGANQGWQKFIANEPAITRPFITIDAALSADENRFINQCGLPRFDNPAAGGIPINIMPFAMSAYQLVYRDYYRPQYLEAEDWQPLSDGDNNGQINDLLQMRRRCFDNDYFTASLPNPQKGAAGVTIPGGTVVFDPTGFIPGTAPTFRDSASASLTGAISVNVSDEINAGANPNILGYDPAGTLQAQMGDLNDFRTANAIQKWLEMFARVGSRYKELLMGAYGIDVEDFRLDRPEFICGVKSSVIVSEVLNTTGETGGLDQGNMAGHGIAVIEGYQDNYFVKEHGYIIGIYSVMPRATYNGGIDRHWMRDSPNDFYWPQFANLGEQATLNAELCAYTTTDTGTFGYMPRYSELRTMHDKVAGDFDPSFGTLPYWTMTRDMVNNTPPNLNRAFLDVNDNDVERIFPAGVTADYLYVHVLHKLTASRLIPRYGTPGLLL